MPRSRCPHCGFALASVENQAGLCPSCRRPLSDFTRTEDATRITANPDEENALLSSLAGETPMLIEPLPEEPSLPPLRKPTLRTPAMMATLTGQPTPIAYALRWGAVRAALATIGSGLFFGIVSLFLLLGVSLLDMDSPSALREVLIQAAGVACLCGIVLVLAGQLLCLAAPSESGAERWVLASAFSLGLGVIGLMLYLVALAHNHAAATQESLHAVGTRFAEVDLPWSPKEVCILGLTTLGALGLGNAFFVLFLRAVAIHFGHMRLAWSLILFLGTAALFVLVAVLYLARPGGNLSLADPGPWVRGYSRSGTPFFEPLLAWFLVEVFLVRDAIARGLLWTRVP